MKNTFLLGNSLTYSLSFKSSELRRPFTIRIPNLNIFVNVCLEYIMNKNYNLSQIKMSSGFVTEAEIEERKLKRQVRHDGVKYGNLPMLGRVGAGLEYNKCIFRKNGTRLGK